MIRPFTPRLEAVIASAQGRAEKLNESFTGITHMIWAIKAFALPEHDIEGLPGELASKPLFTMSNGEKYYSKSIPKEPDMSKKSDNLNTSREVWVECPKEEATLGAYNIPTLPIPCTFLKKITLPAPLTPIAFNQRRPTPPCSIIAWDSRNKEWRGYYWETGDKDLNPNFTHWLPQDALPVPVVEKSLADECEEHADALGLGAYVGTESLLRRAAKELRK